MILVLKGDGISSVCNLVFKTDGTQTLSYAHAHGDTKKRELLKYPTKLKKSKKIYIYIDRN